MRTFICLFVVAAGGWFFTHRHNEETGPAATAEKPQSASVAAAATPAQNSPHNWPKNALDRAGDVKRQVLQQRKENSAAY
jgi:hypothetical protein